MKLKKPVDLTIRIPSDKEFLSLVMDASENLATKIGFDDNKVRKIRTAVGESCANAIEHGNKNDPDKEILLVFHVEETKLEINISDEGKGFDIDKVPTPSIQNIIENPELSKRG
jgi:serine/threonine-protein kinase RsbW